MSEPETESSNGLAILASIVASVGVGLAGGHYLPPLFEDTPPPKTNTYLITWQKTIGTNAMAIMGNSFATGTSISPAAISQLLANITGGKTNEQAAIVNIQKME